MAVSDWFKRRKNGGNGASVDSLKAEAAEEPKPAETPPKNQPRFLLTGKAHSIDFPVTDGPVNFGDVISYLEEHAKESAEASQLLKKNAFYRLYKRRKEEADGQNGEQETWSKMASADRPLTTQENARIILNDLNNFIRHITNDVKVGPITRISLGEEAILLHFDESKPSPAQSQSQKQYKHLLRLTPRGNIIPELLDGKNKYDCVIQHYSEVISNPKNEKESADDIIISVVPQLTPKSKTNAQAIDLHFAFETKYNNNPSCPIMFTDVKPENTGVIEDGTVNGTPVITDLGAIRKFPFISAEKMDLIQQQIEPALKGLGWQEGYRAKDYNWHVTEGKHVTHKQLFFIGNPKDSTLGKAVKSFMKELGVDHLKQLDQGSQGWAY